MFKKQTSVQPEPINLEAVIKRLDHIENSLRWIINNMPRKQVEPTVDMSKMTTTAAALQTPKYTNAVPPRRIIKTENGHKRWTEGDMLLLIELEARGLTGEQIAKTMGRTRRSIHTKLSQLRKTEA